MYEEWYNAPSEGEFYLRYDLRTVLYGLELEIYERKFNEGNDG